MAAPDGIAHDSSNRVYIANAASNTVTVYPPDANGNVRPLAVIGGPDSELLQPQAIALGPDGKIYVLNSEDSQITVYPVLAAGSGILNEAPVAQIGGAEDLPDGPSAIAVDTEGNIYVANSFGSPNVPDMSIPPIGAIGGPQTALYDPTAIAFTPDTP
jgi:sugar lactone lactonase YvrE